MFVTNVSFPKGYIIDRIKAEIEENESKNDYTATFFGERGRKHLFGSMMDLFLAGDICKNLYTRTICSTPAPRFRH